MSATSILINIGAQTAGAVRDIERVNTALGRQMTAGEKASGAIKAAAVPAGLAFAGVAAAAGVSVKAAEEAAAANSKLEQVYSSMGYADLADDAERYAESLSKQIGVDDEVIKGAQTKLATFSEVAKSAGLMGQATSIAADLSAAGFGSMDSASVMLGKALQDPVKGITALSRVGVTFTDQQKAQIEAMVKAGDTAGAQGIIMDALAQQVGGVAEASATGSQKLSVAFGEISESVGTALLPVFDALVPKLQAFADWAAANPGVIIAIGAAIAVVAGAIVAINVAMTIWQAVASAVAIVNAVLGTSFTLALGPVLLVIAAIAAVIAIGVLLVKNWDTISAWLKSTWESIKTKAIALWGSLKDWFAQTWDSIKTKVVEAWEGVKTAVSNGIAAVVTFVKELPGKVLTGIGNLASTLFQKGVDLIEGFIRGYINAYAAVLSFFGDLAVKIGRAIGGLGSALYEKGRDLIEGFIRGIKSMAGRILDAILSILPGPVRGVIRGALGFSLPVGTGAGISAYGARTGGGNTATFNFYGSATSSDARIVKRVLEGYDVSQGRAAGTPLKIAW